MRGRSWRSHAVAVALLAIQLGVSVLGTIGMCVDRPHTHGGIPAPDCLMHQAQSASTTAAAASHGHHHHHDNNAPANSARLACSCSSDPISLLTTEIAILSGGISMPSLDRVAASLPERVGPAPHVRLSPLSPPPRVSLS